MLKSKANVVTLIIILAASAQHSWANTFTFKPTIIAAESSVSPYERCKQAVERLKNDNFSPTYVRITDIEQLWHLQKGVEVSNVPVTLHSRGFRGKQAVIGTFLFAHLAHGESFLTVYKYIQKGYIQTPTVCFDYVDTLKYFDHACSIRAGELGKQLHHVQKKSDNIILLGDSLGAKTILYLATQNPLKNVKAIVLESPLFDMKNMVTNEAQHDFWWLPKGAHNALYNGLCAILPQYKPEQDITYEKLKNIPQDIPIFLAHLHNDHLIDNQTVCNIVTTLRESGHTVYLLVIDNPAVIHSRIATTQPCIAAVNAFYKAHNLPYDALLAEDGAQLLEQALENGKDSLLPHIVSV